MEGTVVVAKGGGTPQQTATVAVEEDDNGAPSDVAVQDVTTSMQAARVGESARPKAGGAAQASTSPRAGNLPFFEITITDYAKKGDNMNAYIVYTIQTKTSSTEYKSPTATVQRRFNHFVWLYEQLTNAYHGVIVPPIPEKQAIGRFEPEFLSARKNALEKCLRRIVAHPVLYQSTDLKLFLEEDNLDAAMNKKLDVKKVFMTGLSGLTTAMTQAQSTFVKPVAKDDYFEAKRVHMEAFEKQLRLLLGAAETMVKARKDLAASLGDFGSSVKSLGTSDSNQPLASALTQLGEVQEKLKGIQLTQAESDELEFVSVVDEYVRLIGSVKVALLNRQKLLAAKDAASANVIRKREALEKARGQPNKATKIGSMEQELEDAESAERKLTQEVDDCTAQLKDEFARFDDDKVRDFQQSAAQLVQSLIESQKKAIDAWTQYLPELQQLPAEPSSAA